MVAFRKFQIFIYFMGIFKIVMSAKNVMNVLECLSMLGNVVFLIGAINLHMDLLLSF